MLALKNGDTILLAQQNLLKYGRTTKTSSISATQKVNRRQARWLTELHNII